MALTLVEASKLSNNVLQKGVIETMVRTTAVLEVLPFMEIHGNAYVYNQVAALPTVAFRDVNEGYVESGSTFVQETANLVMLGGDVDVDKFIIATRGDINNQRAIQTELKAKAIAQTYTKTFFNGTGTNKEFKGLKNLVKSSQKINCAGELTLAKLNELVDKVPFGADVLFMSRTVKRHVMDLLQASNHYIEMGQDAFGRPVTHYAGIPIRFVEDDVIESGVIYAVKLGIMSDVCGLQNGSIDVRDLGELETKPCYRTRIEWYCGMAMFNPLSVAKLEGITGVAAAASVASARAKK